MSKGIDYGLGQTNIDHETGIRFGVISQHSLDWWGEEAEPNYGGPHCPKCGNEAQDIDKAPEDYNDNEDWTKNGMDFCCLDCKYVFDAWEAYPDEPHGWTYEGNGIEAHQSGDDSDVWVTKSPYYTRAQFCSPCAPGACHLDSPTPEGEKAYCFGHDWFDGGVAPYPVYRIAE